VQKHNETKELIMDIVEFFLHILRLIIHIFEVATDLVISKNKKLDVIVGLLLGLCLLYFLKIDSIDDASSYPIAISVTCGIYLSYSITSKIIKVFKM